MMMQHSVQERVADINTNNTQLPPLNNLPQWSRINTLDRARYPKPFLKDRLNPLPDTDMHRSESLDSDDQNLEMGEMNPAARIQHLEKSINFLRLQHKDVLSSLHEEIELLKKENKDLHFKYIVSQKALASASPSPPTQRRNATSTATSSATDTTIPEYTTEKNTTLKGEKNGSKGAEHKFKIGSKEAESAALEEEIIKLRIDVHDLDRRNIQLTDLVAKLQTQQPHGDEATGDISGNPGNPLPIGTSTIHDYEAIIRHLQAVNDKQSHELMQLKSDLRDVLYSHKWTPDAFLLAKAYIADDTQRTDLDALPKLSLKHPTRKLPDVAYIQDTVSLPALKSTVGNKATERKKRTQILQKARMRKEVLQ